MSSSKKFSLARGASSKGNTLDKSNDARTANRPATQSKKMIADKLAKMGITQVPVDYYHYGAFRYTNLKDALAQAERDVQSQS